MKNKAIVAISFIFRVLAPKPNQGHFVIRRANEKTRNRKRPRREPEAFDKR
jgi:hypothetical protein